MTTEQNHIDILLLQKMVEQHEKKLEKLEKDRDHALKAGFITLGGAVISLIVYIWHTTTGK